MAALERANRIRSHRAQLKRQVKAGEMPVGRLIESPDEMVETMKVFDVLLAAPKVGRVKAQRALAKARVSPSRSLAGLTDRQRRELLSRLPG